MPTTTAFVPPTIGDEFVTAGATSNPFTGLTITTNDSATSTQLIESQQVPVFASDPALTDLGKITDSTGGGQAVSPTTFLEVNTIGAVPGDTVLKRLQFLAPKLSDGQSIEENIVLRTATSLTAGGPLNSNVASTTFNIDVVTAPNETGAVATQADNDTAISPFATMTVVDTDFKNTGTDTATIIVTDGSGTPTDADGTLTGAGLSKTGVGTYSIPNTVAPATLTALLQKLAFTPIAGAADKTTKFEVDVTDTKANLTHKDTTTSVLTKGTGNVNPPPGSLTVLDTTTGKTLPAPNPPTPFTGPVPGITSEYVNITPDNINISTTTPNWFLHSGSGEDAIDVSKGNGTNVLDGATGSNFLVGGTGNDTFYLDDRSASANIWSTVVGFHSGDDATVWGITAADFTITTADGKGAAGFTGLTWDFAAAGKPDAKLTLAGFSSADLTGKLAVSFGTTPDMPGLPGSHYMLIHAV
jgi:hypothetical protein